MRIKIVIDSETKGDYSHHNPIKFKLISSLESSLCDYSDAYNLVTGDITATGGNANTKVANKNWAPFKRNVEEKPMILLLMKQILSILQCLCRI